MTGFLQGLESDCNMAFVVVTHLNPEHASQLHSVLQRHSDLTVSVAEDGAEVKSGEVYVMPETSTIRIVDGRLELTPVNLDVRERKPIDVFFSSLGRDCRENAAAVVLSGGDGDGTLGLKVIKEFGGFTFAQIADGFGPLNPEMPESAISAGLVDFQLPVHEMGEKLREIQSARAALDRMKPKEREAESERVHLELAELLHKQTGHDFSGYKNKTFFRRVRRRMQVLQLSEFESYLARLREDSSEINALFRDLLIGVTDFFRDGDAFEALGRLVLPKLLEDRMPDGAVRIWVPACTTGEEVFSLAILLREHMDRLNGTHKVQIFATDIDERALGVARSGRYPPELLANVSEDRLKRFFDKDGATYAVRKEVRDMCIFSPHNVINDPPFSRMDLVSCRNLLIYFGTDLQRQVIPTFHYALKPGGFLFLGTSESISQYSEIFETVEKKQRIFRSLPNGTRHWAPATSYFSNRPMPVAPGGKVSAATDMHLRHRVERQVLEHYAPAHVVVRKDGEVVHFSGRTGRYLEMPKGAPNRQLLELVRPELRFGLRAALRQVTDSGRRAIRVNLPFGDDARPGGAVTVIAEPLDPNGGRELLVLVLFREGEEELAPSAATGGEVDDHSAAVQHELREMRERLQSTVEEYETALEELKSSNEELVSVNEEAQSSNEELEASKEEMQSLNEELNTINQELHQKIEQLDNANADLRNLYEATQIATVFLDEELVIRNFTPSAGTLFNLRNADLGRPLTELASVRDYPELKDHIKEVFASGTVQEHRLSKADDGRHYLVRLNPYLNDNEHIRGAVVTFVDVSSLAEAEAHQRVLIAELNHRVKNMLTVAIGIVNATMRKASSIEEVGGTLIGRMHSMARAYSLLSQSTWTKVELRDLLKLEVEAVGDRRVHLSGPEVKLESGQATAIGMIAHELTTNALKYGALSVPEGRIDVTWQHLDGEVTLQWQEIGGPPAEKPEQTGFGMVLISGQVEHQLGGRVHTSFDAKGLCVRMIFGLKSQMQEGNVPDPRS